jgi:hypothetical protein
MIDDTKTEPAKPNGKPAAAKSAKPAAASAVAAKSEPPAAKAAPVVPARNPLKPKPATPVVPVDRVRPTEIKAASPAASAKSEIAKSEIAKSETAKPETAAAPPAPVPAATEPAPVVTQGEPAGQAKAAETATKPPAATASTPKAPAPVGTKAQPPVAAESKPVVAAPAEPAPARTVKAAAKPAPRSTPKAASSEIIDIPAAFEAFRKPADAVGEEWPKTFGTLAATGLDQTRDTYRRMRRSAERLGEGFEDGAKTAQTGLQEFQIRWFDAVRSQTDATLGFMKAMTEVRSLSDAIELNASHARLRFEETSAQAKDLAAVATRTLSKTGETVRNAMTESISPRG